MTIAPGTLVMIVTPGAVPLGHIGTTLTPVRAYRIGWFGYEPFYQVRFPSCPAPNADDVWMCRPREIIPILPPGRRERVVDRQPEEAAS